MSLILPTFFFGQPLINIYTAPPEFDFNAYGAFTYGNYDAVRVEAGINAPLGDKVAARVDGVYFEDERGTAVEDSAALAISGGEAT